MTTLLNCSNCGQVLANETSFALDKRVVPDDFSTIQIGTSGEHRQKKFEVIGRFRLQFRHDYRNFWYIQYEKDDSYGWIIESFGHYVVCSVSFFLLDAGRGLSLDTPTRIAEKTEIQCTYFDFCEAVTYEGELGLWNAYMPGFRIASGTDNEQIAAFFFRQGTTNKVQFLVGELAEVDALKLKNIRVFNEWVS